MRGEGFDDVVLAAGTGDSGALAALYERFQPAVLGFLSTLAPGEAEDLAAEAWIDIARALPELEGEADFRRLLFTIARRRAIDHGRRRQRRRTDATDPRALPEADPVRTVADEVADVVADKDAAAQAIARIRALLPAAQAEVVVLRVVAGLSVPEVAAVIGRSTGTVSVLQNRGLRRLAERLGSPRGWARQSGMRPAPTSEEG